MNFVKAASEADLAEGDVMRVEISGVQIALAKVDGKVYAFSDICTHEEANLSDGFLEGHCIECPWHGAQFDIRTGKVQSLPADSDLRTYEVKIEEGDILVAVA